jgi:hypothetical protein
MMPIPLSDLVCGICNRRFEFGEEAVIRPVLVRTGRATRPWVTELTPQADIVHSDCMGVPLATIGP